VFHLWCIAGAIYYQFCMVFIGLNVQLLKLIATLFSAADDIADRCNNWNANYVLLLCCLLN